MLSFKCAIVLVLLHLSLEEKLPKFFKLCKINSIDLAKCIEENANFVLPRLLKGVSELNIPPLINLKVPKITSPSYVPYDFNFEGNITKLESVFYNDIVFDSTAWAGGGKLFFPKLELQGKYKIHGFVGKTTMSGKGQANVTIHNLTLGTYWTARLFNRNGTDYYQIVSGSLLAYNVSSINYHFDNLIGEDNIEGELANQILNKYWWILAGDFLPHVSFFLMEVAYETVTKVFADTALDEVFLPF